MYPLPFSWFLRRLLIVIVLLVTLPGLGWAQFVPNHLFVQDIHEENSSILEYDADLHFVRSFRANLPPGYHLGGGGDLRFGPEGKLYQVAQLAIGYPAPPELQHDWQWGIMEWGPGGVLLNFTPLPPGMEPWAFTPMGNGNWFLRSYSDGSMREYGRDFGGSWDFCFSTSADESCMLYGGRLYGCGAFAIVVLDPVTRTEVLAFGTLGDNSDIAVSPFGEIAVNYQWFNPDEPNYITMYNREGNLLGTPTLPDLGLSCDRGLTFNQAGWLYVATSNADGQPQLAIFDRTGQFQGLRSLPFWRGAGSLAIMPPSLFALHGTVLLEDLDPFAEPQPILFTFRNEVGDPLFTRTASIASDGTFTVADVPNGNYIVHIKGAKWLAKNVTVDLTSGDANDDNSADVLDLDLLIQAFDSTPEFPNWNTGADFNGDNSVDVLDLDLLLRNFDIPGDL